MSKDGSEVVRSELIGLGARVEGKRGATVQLTTGAGGPATSPISFLALDYLRSIPSE